jgi:Zn2+/Cd2+-exporting ATPase
VSMSTTEIEIPVLLPEILDLRDKCIQRLCSALESKDGLMRAHVAPEEQGAVAKLCIHYDRAAISLASVERIARQCGAEIGSDIGHLSWRITPLRKQRRVIRVSAVLRSLAGVLDCNLTAGGDLSLEYRRSDFEQQLVLDTLRKHGLELAEKPGSFDGAPDSAAKPAPPAAKHDHSGLLGHRAELAFVGVAGVFLLAGWLPGIFADAPGAWPGWLYIAAYFFGGFFAFREAIEGVLARKFEIDFLMLVAAAGAAALGAWAEGALLLFLFSLGHALEQYAMGRASRAIEKLADLSPAIAIVRRQGREFEVATGELEIGDIVVVRPNSRLAADGFVIEGESTVNQAPITGESMPVDKIPVRDRDLAQQRPDKVEAINRVFAGTINGNGALAILVTKRATDSTLARVVKMVAEADAQRSPSQRFADRFERIFVPSVLVLVVVVFIIGAFLDDSIAASFYRAMALLVAASPCALAIATPSAVLSGVARAAQGGVLVKGGAPLENLGVLQAIAFDKTGTLTEGKPRLTDVWCAQGVTEIDLLTTAIAVERQSDHPLASAVVRDGKQRIGNPTIPQANNVNSITGRGVRAQVGGVDVFIGNDELFDDLNESELPAAIKSAVDELEKAGRTTMIVRRDKKFLGVLGLMDTPRASAIDVIQRLRALGVRQLIMISGDNQRAADAVAQAVGMTSARGDLMPDEKVTEIASLREQYGKVAMIGDGVNDAPAMANATVGIAMGAAGSDVALETADVALMADDLTTLPYAVGLSRATSRIIRQNLWVSLGVVALLIPATISGLGIGPAIVMHEGSTLVVVANALRLLAYRE